MVAVVLIGGWWLGRPAEVSDDELLEQARAAARDGRDEDVRQATERVLARRPGSIEALALWAPVAWDRGDREEVVRRLQAIDDGRPGAGPLLSSAGSLAIELGWAAEAEDCLLRAVDVDPRDARARNRLAYLYGVQGRVWEMQAQLFELLRAGQVEIDHLLMLEAGEPVARDDQLVERCRRARPDESLVLLGPARSSVFEGRAGDALAILRRITESTPRVADGWAQLGLALLDADPESLPTWEAAVPNEVLGHPDVRVSLGLAAEHRNDTAGALDHLAVAVHLNPDHRGANYQFARLLESLGHRDRATAFATRSDRLRELADAVDKAYRSGAQDEIRRCAELTQSLGRPWESVAWCRLAIARFPNAAWARELHERLEPTLAADPPRSVGPPVPSSSLWGGRSEGFVAGHVESRDRVSTIRFREVAEDVGIDVEFHTSPTRDSETNRMYESFGGGVAVLDFDADGDPDLYFTRGGSPERGSPDRLYRNVDGRFEDVGELVGAVGLGYGNAAVAGDVDGDGFVDLLVANLGRNQVLLNNGDGTFHDATEEAGLGAGTAWTTGFGIADFDADGLADVYELNYLDFDRAPFTRCERGHESSTCGPDPFEAAPDRLWSNRGDGRFDDVTSGAGIANPNGKGLGLVVAELDDEVGLDVFVANDNASNLLFLNGTNSTERPRFEERGLVSGVAFDRDGFVQACMGVAADDVTGNGRVDLFVTNFSDQSNTLYAQESAGLFNDSTRRAGLRAPSFAPLGFGTQFLDADLDGWPDLAVANGHVFDLAEQGGTYRMRPQFFRNRGGGQFEELASSDVGTYFETRLLGRGMARLDWNGDGREEFVVSNVGSTASVLVNESEPVGNWIAVRLVDTIGERTAIGTRVAVRTSGRDDDPGRTRQLLAGDGYQASNERQLVFGLPERPTHVNLTVTWPDGSRSEYDQVATASHWLVRRGSEPLALPSD